MQCALNTAMNNKFMNATSVELTEQMENRNFNRQIITIVLKAARRRTVLTVYKEWETKLL